MPLDWFYRNGLSNRLNHSPETSAQTLDTFYITFVISLIVITMIIIINIVCHLCSARCKDNLRHTQLIGKSILYSVPKITIT